MMTRIMLWQMVCKPWSLSPHGAPGRLSLVESTPPPQPYIAKPPGDARSPFRASSLLSLGSVSANGCVALAALTMTSSGGLWLGASKLKISRQYIIRSNRALGAGRFSVRDWEQNYGAEGEGYIFKFKKTMIVMKISDQAHNMLFRGRIKMDRFV